jgi:hypothetical protein
MQIADQHPGLVEKITDALRDAGYTELTVHHSSSSATIVGAGPERSLIVHITDPALAPRATEDGRFVGGAAASEHPPSRAVKASAAGVEQRGGSSTS